MSRGYGQETLVTAPCANASQLRPVPSLLRGFNYVALGLLVLIVVPASVIYPSQLLVVLPVLALLIGLHWYYSENRRISALYFGLSLCVVLWVIFCENIVTIDNASGGDITSHLKLDMRRQAVAKAGLKNQALYREVCCGDPLSYHYVPGSPYRLTYDCSQCTAPYETIVDSTGYLNRQHNLIKEQIDLFLAGDSTLQGYGVPSVVEFLNDLLPITIWNLSHTRYGPRQKVNTLITYALPRHPKWIILEFLSENDVSDAITDEVCEDSGNYVCHFNMPEKTRRVLQHPVFGSMVDRTKVIRGMFDDYNEKIFTLAVTRSMIDRIKGTVKQSIETRSIAVDASRDRTNGNHPQRFSVSDVPDPGVGGDFKVLPTRKFEWVKEGMPLTFAQYDRLATEVAKMPDSPTVILLYNPSAYEIYRDVRVDRDREVDRRSEFQRRALSDYARKKGWMFVDLTASLSDGVARNGVWIYGDYDRSHWSSQGTRMVAPVMARELSKALGPKGSVLK